MTFRSSSLRWLRPFLELLIGALIWVVILAPIGLWLCGSWG